MAELVITELENGFVQRVRANLGYWLRRSQSLSEMKLSELDRERTNLVRAVEWGLRSGQTVGETAELVEQLFPLIERRGYWREWIPYLEQTIQQVQRQPGTIRTLRNQLGHLYRLNRDLTAARDIHLAVAADAEAMGAYQPLAEACYHLATIELERHQPTTARSYAGKAAVWYERLGLDQQPLRAAALFNLQGQIADALGEHQEARRLFLLAESYWAATEEISYRARTLINLGRTLTALEAYEQAQNRFEQALKLLSQTTNEYDKSRAYLNLGVSFFLQEKLSQAEESFRQANSHYLQRSGHGELQAYVYNNLGHVRLERGDFDEAAELLEESDRLWEQEGNDLMQGNSLGALAEARAGQHRRQEAIILYDRAITLLSRFPDNAWANKQLAEYKQKQALLETK